MLVQYFVAIYDLFLQNISINLNYVNCSQNLKQQNFNVKIKKIEIVFGKMEAVRCSTLAVLHFLQSRFSW